jgi:hypothetical protein
MRENHSTVRSDTGVGDSPSRYSQNPRLSTAVRQNHATKYPVPGKSRNVLEKRHPWCITYHEQRMMAATNHRLYIFQTAFSSVQVGYKWVPLFWSKATAAPIAKRISLVSLKELPVQASYLTWVHSFLYKSLSILLILISHCITQTFCMYQKSSLN